MVRRDEGALETVGWGPFALFGERKRLREAEERRLEEVKAAAASADTSPAAASVDTPAEAFGKMYRILQAKSGESLTPGARPWTGSRAFNTIFSAGPQMTDLVPVISILQDPSDLEHHPEGYWLSPGTVGIDPQTYVATKVKHGDQTYSVNLDPQLVARYSSPIELTKRLKEAITEALNEASQKERG